MMYRIIFCVQLVLSLRSVGASTEVRKVCRVATATGSRFLDKRCEIEVDREISVGNLKQRIAQLFPGQPPVAIQRLFYGTRYLDDDDETLAEIEADDDEEAESRSTNQISLVLDTLPPLAAGQHRTPDLTEDRIRALAAETVALERAWRLVRNWRTLKENDQLEATEISTEISQVESALIDDTLAAALEKKRSTIVPGYTKTGLDDAIIDWDAMNRNAVKPSLFFYVDWRESIKVTLALLVAAKFGTQDPTRAAFFYTMIPVLIGLQTRPARLFFKFLWYMIPRGPQNKHAFFNVLLSGPQQAILSINENQAATLEKTQEEDKDLALDDADGDEDDDEDDWQEDDDEEEE